MTRPNLIMSKNDDNNGPCNHQAAAKKDPPEANKKQKPRQRKCDHLNKLLEENWKLQFEISARDLETAALRLKCRYHEDAAAFMAEKIKLEDVIASLLDALAASKANDGEVTEMINRALIKSVNLKEAFEEQTDELNKLKSLVSRINRKEF